MFLKLTSLLLSSLLGLSGDLGVLGQLLSFFLLASSEVLDLVVLVGLRLAHLTDEVVGASLLLLHFLFFLNEALHCVAGGLVLVEGG